MPKIPMPEPLPVDVVQTWWDYFVAKRGFVANQRSGGNGE
jgi:hypothetical protein